jgi:hypothetical protein
VRLPNRRTQLSLLLVTCLAVLRLMCACPEGLLRSTRADAQHPDHACCSDEARHASSRGHEGHHDATGCPHCGQATLAASGELKVPAVTQVAGHAPALPLVLRSMVAATRTASVLPSSTRPEWDSGPPDLPVLQQTCVLII